MAAVVNAIDLAIMTIGKPRLQAGHLLEAVQDLVDPLRASKRFHSRMAGVDQIADGFQRGSGLANGLGDGLRDEPIVDLAHMIGDPVNRSPPPA